MYLAKQLKDSIIESTLDGSGFRIVLFTCGCPHHCNGCHNVETWNINNGVNYSVEEIADYLADLYMKNKGYHKGFTFSGGDPLYQSDELLKLIILLKEKLKDKNFDVWVYTGYLYEDVKNFEVLKHIDYLMDGKFIKEERTYPLKSFRGSNNQRLLELKNGEVVSIN